MWNTCSGLIMYHIINRSDSFTKLQLGCKTFKKPYKLLKQSFKIEITDFTESYIFHKMQLFHGTVAAVK